MAEIERKFLLAAMPDEEFNQQRKISQGYVFLSPGEMRIRRDNQDFFLTVKGDGTISREEWEEKIPEWVFNTLWPKTAGCRVSKLRSLRIWQGHHLEFDLYQDQLSGLFTMECEFSSQEEAERFVVPDWVGKFVEVTNDFRFKNKNLAVLSHEQAIGLLFDCLVPVMVKAEA